MAWNPDTYNQFKKERYAPFDDLVKLLHQQPAMQVIDLGCGTGELTRKLAEHLQCASVLGIDASAEMLAKAAIVETPGVQFKQQSIEQTIAAALPYDLVFSHAAIQWLDQHQTLIPQLITLVKPGGQLAIQLPSNHDHYTHTLLHDMSVGAPYSMLFRGWTRDVSTLSAAHYAQILFDSGGTAITVIEKVYPHVLEDAAALFNWMLGTALNRYLNKLPEEMKESFAGTYKRKLLQKYPGSPVFYPFKRIIMAATFGQRYGTDKS